MAHQQTRNMLYKCFVFAGPGTKKPIVDFDTLFLLMIAVFLLFSRNNILYWHIYQEIINYVFLKSQSF